MKKLNLEPYKTFVNIYTIFFLIIMHLSAWFMYMTDNNMFEQPTGDIILTSIILLLAYLFCNLAILIPFIILMSVGFIVSSIASLSIPLYLLLTLLETLGSNSINLLQYGFFNGLLICIIATPIGILNLIALHNIYKQINGPEYA